MADSSNLDRIEFLTHEIHSESTIPLLQYFIKCKEEDRTGSEELFHQVKGKIGHRDREIPDEAVQLQRVLLSLIANGPRKDGEKLDGSPTVSAHLRSSTQPDQDLGNHCRSRGFWSMRRLRTEKGWVQSHDPGSFFASWRSRQDIPRANICPWTSR